MYGNYDDEYVDDDEDDDDDDEDDYDLIIYLDTIQI